MKRCQPDGRSDVRTFLFPWSWVSPLTSRTDYLPVERKETGVSPAWPQPQPCSVPVSVLLLPLSSSTFWRQMSPVEGCAELRAAPESPCGAGSGAAASFHWHPEGGEGGQGTQGQEVLGQRGGWAENAFPINSSSDTAATEGGVRWAGGEHRGGVLGRA